MLIVSGRENITMGAEVGQNCSPNGAWEGEKRKGGGKGRERGTAGKREA